jgi:restriction system protein
MGRRKDSILDSLLISSWWISVILAIVAYVGLGIIVPNLEISNMFLRGPAMAAPTVAPMVAALLGVAALFSSLRTWNRRRLLDTQSSIEDVRKLDWRKFERLVGEAFRRKGYTVHERGQNGPDGGVDLELYRGSDKILVQCKHWKTWKVSVGPVRELFGVMVAEGASDAIFVTSGQYTREAWLFAKDNNLALFDGPNLIELLDSVRADTTTSSPVPVFKPALPVLVSLAIIVGAVWLGNPLDEHRRIQMSALPGVTSQPGKAAAVTTKKQEPGARARHEQLAAHARKLFESSYRAPNGCENWRTNQKMLECGNDRIRAKRFFLAQHPELASISEIDLQ